MPRGELASHQRAGLARSDRRSNGAAKGLSRARATQPQKLQQQQQPLEYSADLYYDLERMNPAGALSYLPKGWMIFVGGIVTIIIASTITPIHTPLLTLLPAYIKLYLSTLGIQV